VSLQTWMSLQSKKKVNSSLVSVLSCLMLGFVHELNTNFHKKSFLLS
jgi:hypothetical protein